MASSSSSSSYPQNPNHTVKCFCGFKAPLRTSYTENNPGRRFFGCITYKREHGCSFFVWFDPFTCGRGMEFGRSLVRKYMALQAHNSELKRNAEDLVEKIEVLMTANEELKFQLSRMNEDLQKLLDEKKTSKFMDERKLKVIILMFVIVLAIYLGFEGTKEIPKKNLLYLP